MPQAVVLRHPGAGLHSAFIFCARILSELSPMFEADITPDVITLRQEV